jgi:hypothetical protein
LKYLIILKWILLETGWEVVYWIQKLKVRSNNGVCENGYELLVPNKQEFIDLPKISELLKKVLCHGVHCCSSVANKWKLD